MSPQPDIIFTIDGVEYTTADRKQKASELLALAGLNPGDHDLARVTGKGEVEHRFHDADEVQLTPKGRYISIFTGSTPVA